MTMLELENVEEIVVTAFGPVDDIRCDVRRLVAAHKNAGEPVTLERLGALWSFTVDLDSTLQMFQEALADIRNGLHDLDRARRSAVQPSVRVLEGGRLG